jgi:hypothetical protein
MLTHDGTFIVFACTQAKAAMPLFNQLVDAVAADEAYLTTTLAPAAAQDSFTARLLRLLADSAPGRAQLAAGGRQVVLGVHRSDYMLDAPSGGFLQVSILPVVCEDTVLQGSAAFLQVVSLSITAVGMAQPVLQ